MNAIKKKHIYEKAGPSNEQSDSDTDDAESEDSSDDEMIYECTINSEDEDSECSENE